MARSQCEKTKEALMEKIEEYSEKPFSDSVAEHLNVYHGALKALCALGKKEYQEAPAMAQTEEKMARTVEMDGDTEFEKLIVSMPFDIAHAKAVANIFADHMESLSVMNRRAYDNVMMRLREVSRI